MKYIGSEQPSLVNRIISALSVSEIYEAFRRRIGALTTTIKREPSEEFCADCVMVLRVSCTGCLPRSKRQELSKMLSDMSCDIGGGTKFHDTNLSIQISGRSESVKVRLSEAGGVYENVSEMYTHGKRVY